MLASRAHLTLMFVALSCLCGTGSAMVVAPTSTSGPSGLSRWLINTVLASPLYKAVLVPQAKATMVKTDEKNGVPWTDALAWLESRGPWELPEAEQEGVAVPDYYREPFHAYESGNLCWEAALEGEIASRESPPFQPASRPSDLVPTWPSDGPTWALQPSARCCRGAQLSGGGRGRRAGVPRRLRRGAGLARRRRASGRRGGRPRLRFGHLDAPPRRQLARRRLGARARPLAALPCGGPACMRTVHAHVHMHTCAHAPTCRRTCTSNLQPGTCRAGGSAAECARSCPGGGGRRGRRLAVGQRLARLHGRTGGSAPR